MRTAFSRPVFAAAMIALGLIGLVKGSFYGIWSGVPEHMPGRTALASLCGAIALGTGAGLLFRRTAAIAARVLLGSLVLWMLFFRLPLLARAPLDSGIWWACGETLVMIAAAWALAVLLAGARGLRVAQALYGLGLIPFGIAHFTFLARTVSMVPGWLPWHLGWAYLTGGLLIAAGVAIVVGVFGRMAALLSAVELSLFTLLVWLPVIAAGADASQWNEFVDSVILTAAAWVVADSYRGAGAKSEAEQEGLRGNPVVTP